MAFLSKRNVAFILGWLCLPVALLAWLIAVTTRVYGCEPDGMYHFLTPFDCVAQLQRHWGTQFLATVVLAMSVTLLLGAWWERHCAASITRDR